MLFLSARPFSQALSLARVTRGRRLCVIAFTGGAEAHDVSAMSDEHVRAALVTQLRSALPGLPDPVRFARTAWEADPWSLCSYSFAAVGAEPGYRAALCAGAHGAVWLAGEATCEDWPSTVRGAFVSGERAARDALASIAAGM